LLHKLGEVTVRWDPDYKLQMIVLELGSTNKVLGGVPDPVAFRCVLAPEECLATVQPGKRGLLAMEHRELEADARVEAGVGEFIFLWRWLV
jgi:hypothetical protein